MSDIVTFSAAQLNIVHFCAIECELQVSGERSVYHMLIGWRYAHDHRDRRPDIADVLALGAAIEPAKNANGFRKVAVRVGWEEKLPAGSVPDAMTRLCTPDIIGEADPGHWFRAYENIHPFIDGNGRTGQLLYNWLGGTLDDPDWAPNYWDDPRREPGRGAPRHQRPD